MSLKTVNPSMSRETLQLRLLKTNLGIFALTLLGTTWQLWIPQTRFPQIPLFEWVSALPAGIDWLTFGIMLATAGGLLLFSLVPILLKRSEQEPAAGWQRSCGLLFLSAYAVSVLFDQHRLQPWTYQFALGLLVLTCLKPPRAIRLMRLFVISIYLYSAFSKCDASFVQTLGRQLAEGLFSAVGISTAFWSPKTLGWIAATFPVGELLVAAGLFFRRTRKPALVAAIGMHVCLMLAIGPWGLNHYRGVLIWNIYFIIQDLLLFTANQTLDCPRTAKTEAQISEESLSPGRATVLERVPLLLVWLAILAPLLEPTGYFDHWPAWGLYASRHDRVVLLVNEQARAQLPASLQPFVDPPQPLSPWCRVRVERWSLAELGAPLYPQARFQLGVAIGVGRLLQQLPETEASPRIKLLFEGAANRWTGKRNVSEYTGLKEIEALSDRFWLNTVPRPLTLSD
ncbi:hypothetical protein [Gimesia panareensis]|uniref:hypothetical protein n=1 Tax=Gimesia panareensis TaxID=2527978 RepID=UPI0011A80252|nr:hypothetical protein [Gimesia panareensis]